MLEKLVKNKVILATLLLCMVFSVIVKPLEVEAAGFSASASTDTVSPNSTFTVSYGKGTEAKYSCTVSGGTVVSYDDWIEIGDTGTAKIKAGASGSVTVTITAVWGSTSSYEDIDGISKEVTVDIVSSASSSGGSSDSSGSSSSSSSTTTEVDTRSSDNKLKALSIEGVSLSPSFESGVTSYKAEVWDTDEITISATKNNSEASVSGTGTKSLNLGENSFEIVVTAENGSKKTYKITVTMKESPTQYIEYDGQSFGVDKNVFDIDPFPDFDKCQLELDGEEIYGWYCTELDMTVIYLIDENDEAGFYVYEDGVITSQISLVEINGKNYYVFGLSEEDQTRTGYVYEEVAIGDTTIMGWGFESADFAEYKIIELMNETGDYNEYLYSVADEAFIVSPNFAPVNEEAYVELVDEMDVQAVAIDGQESEIESLTVTSESQSKSLLQLMILSVVLGVLLLGMIIIVIILASKLKKGNIPMDMEFDEDDYDEDDYEDEAGIEQKDKIGIEMQDESYEVFDTDDVIDDETEEF